MARQPAACGGCICWCSLNPYHPLTSPTGPKRLAHTAAESWNISCAGRVLEMSIFVYIFEMNTVILVDFLRIHSRVHGEESLDHRELQTSSREQEDC